MKTRNKLILLALLPLLLIGAAATNKYTGIFTGTFFGDGAGITNVPASTLTGTIPASAIPTNGALLVATNGVGRTNVLYDANIVSKPLFIMAPFISQKPDSTWLMTSSDGVTFDYLGMDPIYSTSDLYAGSGYSARDARFFKWRGNWYMSAWNNNGRITLMQTTNNWARWTTNQLMDLRASGMTIVWPVHWFVDPNETNSAGVATNLHAMTFQSPGTDINIAGFPNDLRPYESHLTDYSSLTSWSTPVPLTAPGGGTWRANVWTNTIDHDYTYWNGYYYSFFKQEGTPPDAYIGLARSTNLITGWQLCPTNGVSGPSCTNDWAGWGNGYEGMSLMRLQNGKFRLYFEGFSGGAMWKSDCEAADFPLGPWETKVQVRAPLPVSDPGFIMLTNAVDIENVLSARGALSTSHGPFTLPHLPDYDVVYPANVFFGGTNSASAGWSYARLVNTQWNGAMISMYIGSAAPAQFDFYQLTKGSGAITKIGTINSLGFSGGGSQLTDLNASQLTSGTVAPARIPSTLQATNGTGYTNTMYNANIIMPPLYLMAGFNNGWPYKIWLCYSVDGINWDYLGPDPIFQGLAGQQITRDARWLVTGTNIYIAVTGPTDSKNSWIFSSTNFAYWQSNRVVDLSFNSSIGHSWGPRWVTDTTNGLHMITQQSTNGTVGFGPYDSTLADPNDFTSWRHGTQIGGWQGAGGVWTNTIDHAFVAYNGTNYCFFKQEDAVGLNAGAYVGLARSLSFTNGWEIMPTNGVSGPACTNDWAGWGVGYEGISVLRLPNGNWRVYFEQYSGSAMWMSECASNNFPLGPWSPKQRLRMPQSFSNPGFLLLTNAVDIVRALGAASQLKRSVGLFDLPHAPYHDTIFGANIFNSGTNNGLTDWQNIDNYDTNRSAIFFNLYTGTGNPEIDMYWIPKKGLAGGVRNSFGIFDTTGLKNPSGLYYLTTATAGYPATNLVNRGIYSTNANNGVIIDALQPYQDFATNATYTVSGFSGLVSGSMHVINMTVTNTSTSVAIIFNGPPTTHFPTNGVSTNAMTIPIGQMMEVEWKVWPNRRTNMMNVLIK